MEAAVQCDCIIFGWLPEDVNNNACAEIVPYVKELEEQIPEDPYYELYNEYFHEYQYFEAYEGLNVRYYEYAYQSTEFTEHSYFHHQYAHRFFECEYFTYEYDTEYIFECFSNEHFTEFAEYEYFNECFCFNPEYEHYAEYEYFEQQYGDYWYPFEHHEADLEENYAHHYIEDHECPDSEYPDPEYADLEQYESEQGYSNEPQPAGADYLRTQQGENNQGAAEADPIHDALAPILVPDVYFAGFIEGPPEPCTAVVIYMGPEEEYTEHWAYESDEDPRSVDIESPVQCEEDLSRLQYAEEVPVPRPNQGNPLLACGILVLLALYFAFVHFFGFIDLTAPRYI
jgi:hypothetical protein